MNILRATTQELADLPRHLLAANGQPYSYPIPDGATIFRKTALARLCRCFPHGAPADGYDMDEVLFEGMQDKSHGGSYDPHFFVARASVDHPGLDRPKAGPVDGLILKPFFSKNDGMFYGDVVALDWWFAEMLASGQLPFRSIEWVDSRLAPKDHPRAKFYGVHDFYLTHCAFMGLVEPAVAGLGPMPAPERFQLTELDGPIEYVHPLAAQQVRLAALCINPTQEVAMHGQATPAAGAASAAAVTAPPDPGQLAAAQATETENARLRAENEQLRKDKDASAAQARAALVEADLSALQAAGQLLPAEIDDMRLVLSALRDTDTEAVTRLAASGAPAGTTVASAADAFKRILANHGKLPGGSAAQDEHRTPTELQAAQAKAVAVTDNDRKVAARFGLKPEDVAAERLGLPAPGASGDTEEDAE